MKRKIICKVCNGNGFVRVPYEQAREEQFANCEFCESQGEVEEEEEQNDTTQCQRKNKIFTRRVQTRG